MKDTNRAIPPALHSCQRSYRIERRFSGQRHAQELVQNLLRAHL